jgi:hypothetical protein
MLINNTWVINPGLFDGVVKSLMGVLQGRKPHDIDYVMQTLMSSNLKKTSMNERF